MDEPPIPHSDHLREIKHESRISAGFLPMGALLLAAAILLTVFAPSVLWLLAYPILILAALAALFAGVALLLRNF